MPVYAVEYAYVTDAAALGEVRPGHREFLRGLLETGHLIASGPLPGQDGALLLMHGEDEAGVRGTLSADPFQQANLVTTVTVRRWDPVIGPFAHLV